jgi:hypothetical protein
MNSTARPVPGWLALDSAPAAKSLSIPRCAGWRAGAAPAARRAHARLGAWWLAAALLVAPALARAADTRGFVFTTDYTTGSLSTIDLTSRGVSQDVANGICSDARLRWHDGLLYVINRLNCDNILVLDPANGFAVVRQFSTGNGTNPGDIVFVSPTKAYVPCYERPEALIVDPSTGAITGQVSLAGLADADGIPEMDRAIRLGDRVFVSLQRLSRPSFQPLEASVVAVIDTRTDALVDADPGTPGVQGIVLAGRNPFTGFAYDPVSKRLLLGCTGSYHALDGGLEWIDPAGLASDGFAVTGAALGSEISDIAWNEAARSYAVVSDPGDNAQLVAFDAGSGAVIDTLLRKNGFFLGDCEVNDRGEVYVCDTDFLAPGLRVYSIATHQELAGPLGTGLPPNQITFDRTSNIPAGVDPVREPPVAWLAAPAPNPASIAARLRYTLAKPSRVRLEVLDVSGRIVRSFVDRDRPAGAHEEVWDLADASGRRVRSGIYLARMTTLGKTVKVSDEMPLVARVVVL